MKPQASSMPAPGIYKGIPSDVYFSWDCAVSQSDLKNFVEPRGKPGRAVRIGGSLFHSLILEGMDVVKEEYATAPEDWNLSTKVGKHQMAEFEKSCGKIGVKPKEKADAVWLAQKILGDPKMKALFRDRGGDAEVSIIAQLEGFKHLSKCRIDKVGSGSNGRPVLVDLKSTYEIGPAEFKDVIVKYGYAAQAAYYVDLYHAITGDYLPWVWACASTQTGETWFTQCPNDYLAFGRKWYQTVFKLYEREEDSRVWFDEQIELAKAKAKESTNGS